MKTTTFLPSGPVVTYTGTLEENRAERVAEIKATARDRIVAIASPERQANLTARAAELALNGGPQTPEEVAEVAAGQAIWTQIKAIRAASNAAEAQVIAAETHEAVWAVSF